MSVVILQGLAGLIATIFNIYLAILIMRAIFAWTGSSYMANPLTQLIVKLTSFIIRPMKKLIRDYHGIEFATITLILLLEIIKWICIFTLPFSFHGIAGLIVLAIGDALKLTLQVFFYTVLFQALLSWVQPGSPLNMALDEFTSPIMRPLKRCIPSVSGFDVTPIPALIILQLLIIIIANPLVIWGFTSAVQ